jgi:hypothetical protein
MIRPQRMGHTPQTGHKVTRAKAILTRAGTFSPEGDKGMTARKPPVFIEVVPVQLYRCARGKHILMQRRRVDGIKFRGQGGIDLLALTGVDDAKIKVINHRDVSFVYY